MKLAIDDIPRSVIRGTLLLFLNVALLCAQSQTSQLTGVITDPQNSRIIAVDVQLTNLDTNTGRHVETNSDGIYVFPGLPPGRYEIRVAHPGFFPAVASPVTVDVSQSVTIDIPLRVGALQDKVDVVAEAPNIDSASAQLGTVITEKRVQELPLNGRNFSQLLLLTPGAAPVSVAQNSTGSQVQRVGSFTFPAINGQSNRSNWFLLDGIYNNAPFSGTYAIALNVDAISQFKVQSHSDQAAFGGATGGVVNIVSKGGTKFPIPPEVSELKHHRALSIQICNSFFTWLDKLSYEAVIDIELLAARFGFLSPSELDS